MRCVVGAKLDANATIDDDARATQDGGRGRNDRGWDVGIDS